MRTRTKGWMSAMLTVRGALCLFILAQGIPNQISYESQKKYENYDNSDDGGGIELLHSKGRCISDVQ